MVKLYNYDYLYSRYGHKYSDFTLNFFNDWNRYIVNREQFKGGYSYKFRFENGFGASVIKFCGTRGSEKDLWELAVLQDDSLSYSTKITTNTLDELTEQQVDFVLKQIKELQP